MIIAICSIDPHFSQWTCDFRYRIIALHIIDFEHSFLAARNSKLRVSNENELNMTHLFIFLINNEKIEQRNRSSGVEQKGQMMMNLLKFVKALDWNFLLDVLEAFGFSLQFRKWILAIFSSARISIMINGKINGYFSCSRGVRQGDPLSPLLFCLAEDFLSRLMSHKLDRGRLSPMIFNRGNQFPTHFFYADDILLFGKASMKNMNAISEIFKLYGNLSGQRVSWEKSYIFYGSAVSAARISKFQQVLDIKKGNLPFEYLGVPLFIGMPKKIWLKPIADRICNKFSKWKGKSLSMAGRLLLIKSVVTSSLLHSFAVYRWPHSLISYIQKCMRNFLWSGSILNRKPVQVPWKNCCLSVKEGGLGIKNLHHLNTAMLSKMAWKLISSQTFPITVLRSRFLHPSGVPRDVYLSSSIWYSIKQSFSDIRSNSVWFIGSQSNLLFWTDDWISPNVATQMGFSIKEQKNLTDLISNFLVQGVWHLDNVVNTEHDFSSQIAALWSAAIISAVWMIWNSRNDAIFEGVEPNIHITLRHIWKAIRETDFYRCGSMHNSEKEKKIISLLNIKKIHGKAPRIIEVKWHPPLVNWIKVNTDGSATGSPGIAGSGGIFRNARGFPKGAFAFGIGSSLAFIAELRAAMFAIKVAWNKGWLNLWLESDSLFVVDALKTKSMNVPWRVMDQWLDCLFYISKMNVVVSHIYREGNVVADILAKYGANSDASYWWDSSPIFCNREICNDLDNLSRYRFV
ncbi:uncharacterized protein LOC126673008 [Mercurialis annua]|uniref:uncharacterized protein LOC126673008 n=1 Tax=Mercurialis annua TaxID=3986 RepID=UPI002160FBCD|nr:uncharacterized protein LOC126673008 [Mercurialis annua]